MPKRVRELSDRPAWQLPPGVSRGTWDYVRSQQIASDYDRYFADDRLMKLDQEVVRRFLPPVSRQTAKAELPVVADFGCGTGRVSRWPELKNYRVLSIDLSLAMLRFANESPRKPDAAAIHANLVQLDCLRDASIDLGLCLYSSLGLIRGRSHRLEFLRSACRCLKQGSALIVHVHNRYSQSWRSVNLAHLVRSRLRSWISDEEFGDSVFVYRSLPQMFLHIFSRREILADMRQAGFGELQLLALNATSSQLLPASSRGTFLRAGGFFVIGWPGRGSLSSVR